MNSQRVGYIYYQPWDWKTNQDLWADLEAIGRQVLAMIGDTFYRSDHAWHESLSLEKGVWNKYTRWIYIAFSFSHPHDPQRWAQVSRRGKQGMERTVPRVQKSGTDMSLVRSDNVTLPGLPEHRGEEAWNEDANKKAFERFDRKVSQKGRLSDVIDTSLGYKSRTDQPHIWWDRRIQWSFEEL